MERIKILIFILCFIFICPSIQARERPPTLLNENLSYNVVSPQNTSSLPFSDKTKAVTIKLKYKNFHSSNIYYIKGDLTTKRLRVLEYDVLINNFIKQNICPVNILNHMSKEEIYDLHQEMYLGYQNFKKMKVPEEVKEIHEMYIDFVKPMKNYLDFDVKSDNKQIFKNSTIVYRIMSSLNSFSKDKVYQKANFKLFNLLENDHIKPAR